MATTVGFPIIGTPTVWSEWNNAGSGAWNMWFMAPYGEWIYAGFVKSNVASFKKINIGGADADYPISSWTFDVPDGPDTKFPYEKNEGYPNGSMGLGCIRGTPATLYLGGRSAGGTVTSMIIRKFPVGDNFDQDGLGFIPFDEGAAAMDINRVCALEVDADAGIIYLATNNNDSNEFKIWRYAAVWDDAGHAESHVVPLSGSLSGEYLENNASARIRGIALASDDNLLVFANTGYSSTESKVFKFDKDDLTYLGSTTWTPSISTGTWAHITLHGEVFMFFRGLDSTSSLDWRTAIYYDRATGIPNAEKSNFIIQENLTTFASDDPIELTYSARDAFNIAVVGANTKFYIAAEDPDDESTWTDRVGAIKDVSIGDFFDADGVPLATSAITATDGNGIATAYYKPMKSGTGTERDTIAIKCPSDS